MIFIHYGHREFDKNLFKKIRNEDSWTKPKGGLWSCSTRSIDCWKQFIDDGNLSRCNYTEDDCFLFKLADNAKVLTINSIADLKNVPILNTFPFPRYRLETYFINFESLIKDGYDAVFVPDICNDGLYYSLYGWDISSILIMNPDIVEQIEPLSKGTTVFIMNDDKINEYNIDEVDNDRLLVNGTWYTKNDLNDKIFLTAYNAYKYKS